MSHQLSSNQKVNTDVIITKLCSTIHKNAFSRQCTFFIP